MTDYPISFYWSILFLSSVVFVLYNITKYKRLDYFAFLILFIIFIFSVSREYISSDYASYMYAYDGGFESDYALIFEPGWTLLTTFLRDTLSLTFENFIALLFFIVIYIKFKSFHKHGINLSLFTYFYITNYWLLFDIGALRRSLALSICIYGLFFLKNHKLKIFSLSNYISVSKRR